jgi:nucleoside-diphosphate-sugar epimerase
VYVQGLRNTLDRLPVASGRIIYVSSTGVYGQNDGRWVDEQSPCQPVREGGRACLAAEQALLNANPLGCRSIVLRMAGIYGPGRIPRRNNLEAGRPIAAPAEGYLNLIHVEDAARVVLAAERTSVIPAVYCVSDGNPVNRAEHYRYLARLIGASEPTFSPPLPDSHAAQRSLSSKRVRNTRLVEALAIRLKYPSYRDGLAAILAAENCGQ